MRSYKSGTAGTRRKWQNIRDINLENVLKKAETSAGNAREEVSESGEYIVFMWPA